MMILHCQTGICCELEDVGTIQVTTTGYGEMVEGREDARREGMRKEGKMDRWMRVILLEGERKGGKVD